MARIKDDPTVSAEEWLRVLGEDTKAVRNLKKENRELKEKLSGLLVNNKEFANLVRALDRKIDKISAKRTEKKYVYSFEEGGWKDLSKLEKEGLDLKQEKITLDDINKQLKDILLILERRKDGGKAMKSNLNRN